MLAANAVKGNVFCLHGDLGVGKTAFARAFIRAHVGDAELDVTSPSYTLLQTYQYGDVDVHHMDMYRVSEEAQVTSLDMGRSFREGITLVEWPQRLGSYYPRTCVDVHISDEGVDDAAGTGMQRVVTVSQRTGASATATTPVVATVRDDAYWVKLAGLSSLATPTHVAAVFADYDVTAGSMCVVHEAVVGRVPARSKCAFVQLATQSEYERALASLHGSTTSLLPGVDVKKLRKKDPKAAEAIDADTPETLRVYPSCMRAALAHTRATAPDVMHPYSIKSLTDSGGHGYEGHRERILSIRGDVKNTDPKMALKLTEAEVRDFFDDSATGGLNLRSHIMSVHFPKKRSTVFVRFDCELSQLRAMMGWQSRTIGTGRHYAQLGEMDTRDANEQLHTYEGLHCTNSDDSRFVFVAWRKGTRYTLDADADAVSVALAKDVANAPKPVAVHRENGTHWVSLEYANSDDADAAAIALKAGIVDESDVNADTDGLFADIWVKRHADSDATWLLGLPRPNTVDTDLSLTGDRVMHASSTTITLPPIGGGGVTAWDWGDAASLQRK